jgi:hypothetical protein
MGILSKKNLIIIGILALTACAIVGITLGVVLSEPEDNFKKSLKILEKNPLIDGYRNEFILFLNLKDTSNIKWFEFLSHNDLPGLIRGNFQNQLGKFDLEDMFVYMNGVNTHTDNKRMRAGKMGGQFWAAFADCDSLAKDAPRLHLEQVDVIKRCIKKYPNVMEYVTTSEGYNYRIIAEINFSPFN